MVLQCSQRRIFVDTYDLENAMVAFISLNSLGCDLIQAATSVVSNLTLIIRNFVKVSRAKHFHRILIAELILSALTVSLPPVMKRILLKRQTQ